MSESENMGKYLSNIKKIKIYSSLTEEELKKILSKSEIVRYKKGDRIISQGEESQNFYAIIRGRVEVSVQDHDEEVLISTINEGEMFGEAAIFIMVKRTASVTALKKTVVISIHRQEMLSFIKENPEAGNKILMLIILSLINKVKDANQTIAFEKKSDIDMEEIDSLVRSFL